MLVDREKNVLHLSEKPNGHMLILGKSGYGKTFFLYRRIEDIIHQKKTLFLLDYSGSFTDFEMKKSKFEVKENVKIFIPTENSLQWIYRGKDFIFHFRDALLRTLNVRSYYQKKLLEEAIRRVFQMKEIISIPLLMNQFEVLLDEKEDTESKKNLMHLLNRFEPFSGISNVEFLCEDEELKKENRRQITIIQISNYTELQRIFLSNLMLEMFWREARCGKKRADIVVLDECQNLNLKSGNALSAMLREGRKFGLSVYLSSQFFESYMKENVETLMQAGNVLFFHPADNDFKLIAKLIDPNASKNWINILNKLRVGEAVLKGNYTINRSKREIRTPIICRVKEEKTYEK